MNIARSARLLAVLAALTLITACASPARIDGMVAGYHGQQAPSTSFLRDALVVQQVSGGRETNPMWTSQVDSASFRIALERSLNQAGLLSDGRMESYWLSAELQWLEQPLLGASFTVKASVRYELISAMTEQPVYERIIQTAYTARFGDALIGTERMKLANEGAIRLNIEQLIADLYNLGADQ